MLDESKLSPASAGFPSTSKDKDEVLGQERQDLPDYMWAQWALTASLYFAIISMAN